ncbi:MAG: hypothetical protein J6U96_01600 [Elusimicrobiaceae bacterium]|nr:hypothetical protein [Elusimicrobiaceae bacterium]
MNLAETLIGKNMKAHPEALGLYIGLEGMYIAQSTRKDGGIVLESLLRVPVPAVDRAKLKPLELNDEFFDEGNWLDALAKVAARKQWKDTKVVVSLSSAFSLLRHFVIPTVIERKHWKEAIPLQARKYIHFPFEKTLYSYHAYEFETAASKQKRLGVIFTMTPKKIVEKLEKGLKSLGLDLVAIEPAPLSLSRAFSENDKEAINDVGRIYSFFGTDMASFVFTHQHAPVLVREVDLAGALPAERRRFELTNCTEFIAKQLERDPFEEAIIMGVNTDSWTPSLEADAKKPVRKWNLREVYGIETKAAGEMAAIGASMKFYDNKSPELDFVKRNRLSDYEFNAGLMAWKIVGVIGVLLFLLFLKNWWGVQVDQHNLKKQKRQSNTAIADFDGLTAQQIQNNLNKIKTQNANLEGVLSGQPSAPLLADIVAAIPNEIWINKLTYKEEFPPKKTSARSLTFEGSIQTGGGADKDIVLGNQFRDKLARMPAIRALCSKPDIQFRALALLGDNNSSRGTRSNKETSFVFTCEKGGSSK